MADLTREQLSSLRDGVRQVGVSAYLKDRIMNLHMELESCSSQEFIGIQAKIQEIRLLLDQPQRVSENLQKEVDIH